MPRLPLAAVALGAALCACSAATPGPTPWTSSSLAVTSRATASATPQGSATARVVSLARCPATPAREASLSVIRRGGQPDDLALDPSGTALWVSDVQGSTLARVALADGSAQAVLRGLSDPEGVVPLPGGDLLVAEQGRDRVVRIHADGGGAQTLATLPPHPSSVLGLDGIALDGGGALLVPDSPHGTLLRLSLGTAPGAQQPTRLATGLGRPVGILAAPDGRLYVAAENEAPRGLLRVDPTTGAATALGSLSQLDDVAWLDGLLYATDLRARVLRAVDPRSGEQRSVATFSGQPQGLAVLPDGRLAVADSDSGLVLAVPACG